MITAIASGVMALAVIGTLVFAVREIRTAQKSRYLQASLELHRDFGALWHQRQAITRALPSIVKDPITLDDIPDTVISSTSMPS